MMITIYNLPQASSKPCPLTQQVVGWLLTRKGAERCVCPVYREPHGSTNTVFQRFIEALVVNVVQVQVWVVKLDVEKPIRFIIR